MGPDQAFLRVRRRQGFNLRASCWDLIYSLLSSRKSFNPGSGRAGGGGGVSFRDLRARLCSFQSLGARGRGDSGIPWDI